MKSVIRNSDILEMKEELLKSLTQEISKAHERQYLKFEDDCQLEKHKLEKEIAQLKKEIASKFTGKERRGK